jgi:hypothetical protein
MTHASGPLTGLRVLELGNFIAAPSAGRLLAWPDRALSRPAGLRRGRRGDRRPARGHRLPGSPADPGRGQPGRLGRRAVRGDRRPDGVAPKQRRGRRRGALRGRLFADGVAVTGLRHVRRVRRRHELDRAIAAWTTGRPLDEVLTALDENSVPAGPIYTAADIRHVRFVVSASDGHSVADAGVDTAGALRRLEPAAAVLRRAGVTMEASIAAAFLCPYDGETAPDRTAPGRRGADRAGSGPDSPRRHHRRGQSWHVDVR